MIGETILHYKILEKLGEGGMGVVYKAEDSRLKREVAIKFLPHHISANQEDLKRFEIEAQAAAILNHPNIATIYAIEESNEKMFIVMEYITGKELKDKIKDGPIPLNEAIEIAVQIADGLEAAHKKGIVHRDIKSSNIMINEDSKVKIMDFGLAKIGKGIQVTKLGTTIGTAAYMSPEQARGEEIDNKTDIWSFGVVLYELLTGEFPFKGDYEQAVMYSILNESPTPPSILKQSIPKVLSNIVNKCLEKDRSLRYQNIKETGNELKMFIENKSTNEHLKQLKRIAILPFVNVSGNPESDYLGFALADQVIGALSYSKDIVIRPSASIRKYVNSIVNLKTAGSELNVDFILNGNFLKVEDQIRLNIELVELKTENMIWRESIKVKFNDAFELQDIVSQKVVEGFKIKFSQNEQKRIKKDIPANPQAYEFYLKAISYPIASEENNFAIQMLEKSIELDKDYAPAYSELGRRYHFKSNEFLGGPEVLRQSIAYFEKALELNDELASALNWLGIIHTEIGEIDNSIEILRKSLLVNPNNGQTHFGLSYVYRYGGALEEAKSEAEKAIVLDPGNPQFRSIGATYYYLGEYEKGKEYLNYDSKSDYSNFWFGTIEFKLGNLDKAMDHFNIIGKNSSYSLYATFIISHMTNDRAKMEVALTNLEKVGISDSEDLYWIAVCHALMGDVGGCERYLAKAIEGGFIIYTYMIKESFLDSVKNDPGITELFELAQKKHLAFKKKFFT